MLLRQDPAGIAPERALVFEVILPVADFQKAAAKAGFELLIEDRLSDQSVPDEMTDEYADNASPTLYATMPSVSELKKLLSMWKSFQAQEKPARGFAPWWKLFGMLSDIRVWGPQDRLTAEVRRELDFRLSQSAQPSVKLELEIWPTANQELRSQWRAETRERVEALGGLIVSECTIDEPGFIYESVLAEIPVNAVREMLTDPSAPQGLATLDGLQFILPQMIAQALPETAAAASAINTSQILPFDSEAPFRVVLLDGTPIAGHAALNGGVAVEDVHNLVPRSQVEHRRHATAMASLILRGDLLADGLPVPNARVLAIPILVDDANGASSPSERLFVDLVHIALTRAFLGEFPIAPEAHVVNFSIAIHGANFAGKIGSLARLLDWWADRHGILFVVSAGNVSEDLLISGISAVDFEDAELPEQQRLLGAARQSSRHIRTLMAPAESMNGLTVGAASVDLAQSSIALPNGFFSLHDSDETTCAVYSAIGLGAFRSIKPDILNCGGQQELRVSPDGANGIRLRLVAKTQRTGLNVAAVQSGTANSHRTRGTSCAAALTTRATLHTLNALTEPGGPFNGVDITPRDKALLTKALIVNGSNWPESAVSLFESELAANPKAYARAREEVCRYFGHGMLEPLRTVEAPAYGTTLLGLGTVQKDKAAIFDVPLPPSLSGQRLGRSMVATIAWFSPVRSTRARYRLAALEAVAQLRNSFGEFETDEKWALDLKSHHLDANIIRRGTIWSRRLVHDGITVPEFMANDSIMIRVQCRDASGGGLSQDDDIRFALALTMEVEAQAQFDIHEEVQQRLNVRLRGGT